MPPKKQSRPEFHQTTLDQFFVRTKTSTGSGDGLPRSTVPQPGLSVVGGSKAPPMSPSVAKAPPQPPAPSKGAPPASGGGGGGGGGRGTTMCKYFASGHCKDGASCSYRHSAAPSAGPVGSSSQPARAASAREGGGGGVEAASAGGKGAPPLCRYFASPTGCAKGSSCPARHYNDFGFGVVKVPWSEQHTYESRTGKLCRYWTQIEELMREVRSANTSDLEELLTLLLPQQSRNSYPTEFSALQNAIDLDMSEAERVKFFAKVLPWMQEQVLAAPSRFPAGIPLLRQRVAQRVVFTQLQVVSLLACCFFNVMPFRHKAGKEQFCGVQSAAKYAELLPYVNMGNLFGMGGHQNRAKIRCLLEYFAAQCDAFPQLKSERPMHIEVVRVVRPAAPVFAGAPQKLVGVELVVDGLIEDRAGVMQADFANRMLGGGVLGRGCVQEEIRFVASPELMVSRVICERLLSNEAVLINGAEQFSEYTGYASTFRFAKRRAIPPPTAAELSAGIRNVCVTAMDAVDFHAGNLNPGLQFLPHWIERETVKAHVAFTGSTMGSLSSCTEGPIATGNWGCGAFAGDLELKMLIQLCAASVAGRPLIYFTFGNEELSVRFKALYTKLQKRGATVGDVYSSLLDYHRHRVIVPPPVAIEPEDLDATPTMEELDETLPDDEVEATKLARRSSSSPKILEVFDHVWNQMDSAKGA